MTRLSIESNERVTFKVQYEDAELMVVRKPSGVVTAPGLGHERDSLLNGLFAVAGPRLQNLGKSRDFGLLHRLDRATSGLVLVALTTHAYDTLREAFETRRVEKYYWAVVARPPKKPSGVIRQPIQEYDGKVPGDSRTKKLARVASSGKPALTAYRLLEASEHAALVECRPATGRLHQVRVHMEGIGCPLLGDDFYAPRVVRDGAPRLALHAHRLAFEHPTTGERVDVRSAWPADLRNLLKRLKLHRPDLPASGVNRLEEREGDAVGDEDS